MDGTSSEYVEQPPEPEITPEMLEEMEAMQEEQSEDSNEDGFMMNQELMDAYGAPQEDEKQNAHTFLHKAAFANNDTVRTTFLHEHELGRPVFSVRFLMDMEDISIYYLVPILKKLNLDPIRYNAIAAYFREKRENVTSSGMSNKGFAMNLNVTRKMDTTRERVKNLGEQNMKGGIK